MKSYNEIANNVFERRDKHIAAHKRKKKIIVSIITPVLCFCIVIITCVGLWRNDFFNETSPIIDTSQNSANASSKNSSQNNAATNPDTKSSKESTLSVLPSKPSTLQTDYYIDSIDKINFYSVKKIISEKSFTPTGMSNTHFSTPKIIPLNKTYTEYPLDRNKTFTATMVTYFTIQLNDEKGFLAQKLGGTGLVEVVVTENNIENMGQMITFKKDNNYYTCLLNGQKNSPNSNRTAREFSSHKYINGFNIVKNFEQENYKFIVYYEGSKVVGFESLPFKSGETEYVADDITFIDDFCVVLFTKQNFTIEELEAFSKNDIKE